MRKLLTIAMTALLLAACSGDNRQKAETMLEQASTMFEAGQYEQALAAIDSLRKLYPNAIDTRKRALQLYQNVELKRSQEELAVVDSLLQAANGEVEGTRKAVFETPVGTKAAQADIDAHNRAVAHRDSLQNRFDTLCGKIRYIHRKQKED